MKPRDLLIIGFLASGVALAQDKVAFNAHIRPILADNCFACHGKDAAHREGDRRLDTFEGAIAANGDIRAIVPGEPEESDLWLRITSTYEDEVMPPPDSHKQPLKPEQLELIKRWIEQGAEYENHWAYEPIVQPPVPATTAGYGDHPVDRFLAAKLAQHGLALAPEAPRDVLLRRVTLDLTGLPPTPEDVSAFAADNSPDAYERVVNRLLASPHYGEHFARYWLDAVRYADTHGLHLDNIRRIWPYRDWVVQALNRNLPFDQFTIEQLAGDMLPNPRVDQLVASGYNRNHLTTSEGGAIEAEAAMRNTADRTDTTAAVWLGLTANCASCHDHKFDPLTQKEYYSLGAIFNGLADRVWDGNVRLAGGPIALIADNPETQRRIDEIYAAVKPLEAAVTQRADELVAGGVDVPARPPKEPITYEVVWAEDSDLPTPENVMAPLPPGEWMGGAGVPVAGGKRALRMDGESERSLAFTAGEVELIVSTEAKPFVHVYLDPANPPRAISLEFITKEKTRRVVWGDATAFGSDVSDMALVAGPLPEAGSYTRLETTACEARLDEGAAYTGVRIAQSGGTVWWDRIGAIYTSPSAADDPLISMNAWARPLRSASRMAANVPLRHDIKFLLGLSPTLQTRADKQRLARFYRDYIHAPLRAALEPEVHAARRLMAEQIHYELTLPSVPISLERADPLPTHVKIRGQYDKPGEIVQPGTPAFLPPIQTTGGRITRLDFARWLVGPEHPLTSRVTVNRFWQQLFGAGIVRTPADFGAQGAPPTHPRLLDWLAAELMRTGWDVKSLVRLIVTSRAYRQDSRVSPRLLELDPDNKLLARGPRLRLDAEVLRDQALALGGLLQPEIGGPPVHPYQPPNVWEPVAYSGSNTRTYVQDHGAALYRRSLYTFWKRTAPAPAMTTFDAPSREMFCVGRGRSNTPLQALALMNDVQQFEAARAFAERLLTATRTDADRLVYAFRSVVARAPTPAEKTLLAEALATHRTHFEQNLDAAQQVLNNGESQPSTGLPVGEFAAWTILANLLLNLDETINRN